MMVVANTTLTGAEGVVVLDSVSCEVFHCPIVHAHGDGHHECAIWSQEAVFDVGIDIHEIRRTRDQRHGVSEKF